MRAVVAGGGVIGMASAFALLDVADSVAVLDAGAVGGGASAGNTGWVTPSIATPLAAPGVLTMGLRSALDPRGALVIRPSLDPAWIAWLWRFARSSRRAVYRRGVAALLELTSRTLDELDRMREAGVEFEEHREGVLVVARDRKNLYWFEKVSLPQGLPAMPLYLCEPKIGTSPYAGRLRIAGFFELGARGGEASPQRSRQLVEETHPYLKAPIAADGDIPDGWAGFRPATPDSLPLLGPVPGAPGVVVATGHGMLGITLAPATGVAVAALARGERPEWIAALDPARFTR